MISRAARRQPTSARFACLARRVNTARQPFSELVSSILKNQPISSYRPSEKEMLTGNAAALLPGEQQRKQRYQFLISRGTDSAPSSSDHKNSVLSSRPIRWAGRKKRTRTHAKTVDISQRVCKDMSHEPETRLPVPLLSDGRAEADACSDLWLCAFCL